jgi:hypothetical protein
MKLIQSLINGEDQKKKEKFKGNCQSLAQD